MTTPEPELAETIAGLRRSLAELHHELVRNGLVVWTGRQRVRPGARATTSC